MVFSYEKLDYQLVKEHLSIISLVVSVHCHGDTEIQTCYCYALVKWIVCVLQTCLAWRQTCLGSSTG